MAINKIKTNSLDDTAVSNAKLGADAVDATKIADDAISEEHIDTTAITGHTQLSANAASDDVLLIFDASSSTIKKINAGNVGLQVPTISSISPTNLLSGDGSGNHTIVITGTGFISDATAKLTTDGGTDIAFDSVTRNSSTQLTCVIAKNTANLTNANEPFDVTVTTAGALTATSANAITIDASPVFVTSAGSLGSVNESTSGSFTVLAQDPESSATAVTYELQSGSLPTNFTLTNQAANGGQCVIAGTAPAVSANTTFNFVIRAVDAASNTTSRAFSILVANDPVSTSFTSSGTFAVPSGMTVVDVLVVGGGGGGGGGHDGNTNVGGGAGAGGLIFMPDYPVNPGGTITVTVGDGGPHINPSSPTGQPIEAPGISGQDSKFGAPGDPGFSPTSEVLTAKGGGAGGGGRSNAGLSGGSGGGGGSSSQYGPRAAGTATQPTQPGDSGAYGFGNNGGTGTSQGKLGSGGGGAGAAGQGGGPGNGVGGNGKAYTIADGTTSVYYAGGGGGGAGNAPQSTAGAVGGQGGGGAGQNTSPYGSRPAPEGQGQANKGGGAGGGATPGRAAYQGGKGIVIVRG